MVNAALTAALEEELSAPIIAEAEAFADLLSKRPGVVAVLFYGSCLQKQSTEGLLDFYVLTDGPRPYGQSGFEAWAGRRLPPNVYQETMGALRAKVAVVSIEEFRARMALERLDTTFWARFCQRAALVWARDDEARAMAVEAVAAAVEVSAIWAERLADGATGVAAWRALFARTYGAELRVEKAGRAADIVGSDENRFERLWKMTAHERAAAPPVDVRSEWSRRRRRGKLLNSLRLVKAAFTFKGGLDYAIWKVERHSGRPVKISAWQRRLPWLAAPFVFLRLLRERRLR